MDIAEFISKFAGSEVSYCQLANAFKAGNSAEAANLAGAWQALDEQRRFTSTKGNFNVGICGYTTLEYLKPYVTWAILSEGLIPNVSVGQYNMFFQEVADSNSFIYKDNLDVLWVNVRLTDLLTALDVDNMAGMLGTEGIERVKSAVQMYCNAVKNLRSNFDGYILVNDFSPERRSPVGIAESGNTIYFEQLYRTAADTLRTGLSEIAAAGVFSLGYFVKQYGLKNIYDNRMRLLADCEYKPEFMFEIAKGFAPYIRSIKGLTKKVLVLDLDNTMWGGVVGEDGWDGVKIGDDPVGKSFSAFQKVILELYNKGIILAVNSKNNPEDAKEVFEKRQEMKLTLDNFASLQINWENKGINCQSIAREINVGIDSLVFWDDNPAEREIVRQIVPEVFVVDPPDDTSDWADYLIQLDLFDTLSLSAEDIKRGRMYAENRQRQEHQNIFQDIQDFLRSLDLKVKCSPAAKANLARIVSLLSRTNQFNLTTKRHTENDVLKFMDDPNAGVFCYDASDKFGSYGIVGVTICKKIDDSMVMDSFLLSCRAMGKGIEDSMLGHVSSIADTMGCQKIIGQYIPTKKNVPVKTFYQDRGFDGPSGSGDLQEFTYECDFAKISIPEHINFTISTE